MPRVEIACGQGLETWGDKPIHFDTLVYAQ